MSRSGVESSAICGGTRGADEVEIAVLESDLTSILILAMKAMVDKGDMCSSHGKVVVALYTGCMWAVKPTVYGCADRRGRSVSS